MTFTKIYDLVYKIENKDLKTWCNKYGVIDCMTNIHHCLKTGFGYLGALRIDAAFMCSLSENDRNIYNTVIDWYFRK